MKLTILAALAVATPALAQTTPAAPGQTMTPPATEPAPSADPAMEQEAGPAKAAAPMERAKTRPRAGQDTTADSLGYQPSQPPMSGPMVPGATVRFQPSMSPDQAFPPPAPLASYPICKRGQYDKCMQRGGR